MSPSVKFLLGFFLVFLPTLVALGRRHPNATAIALLNFLILIVPILMMLAVSRLWSDLPLIVGGFAWIGALVWASVNASAKPRQS